MDKATLIGIISGFGLILGSILLGSGLGAFLDVPSALIVVGGTISATLIMERLENVVGAAKVAKNAFFTRQSRVSDTISVILRLSNLARREGMLALENEAVEDPFLAKGIRMAVDGLSQEEISETLRAELVSMKDRHQRGQKLFRFMGTTAPSMGMIGTLIGLVQMLGSMDDPKKIGPAMAVALLTTLYGAIVANMFAIPIADKLQLRSAEERLAKSLIIDAVMAIQAGQNPRVVQDVLKNYLPKSRRAEEAAAA